MKPNQQKRIYIYAKDVERITGKEPTYCRTLLARIRLIYGKKKHQGVTVDEYCEYMGVSREEIEQFL
ncbi:hypothetical protein [Desertivirga xinjiangensis]|uniref:hypothetical protein n=1 Tax=Desertivirga xinjiangensis TaxID=539206 RepID=UPI00210DCE83|nr:hypothetical protein [Pedobacter xinjiangensis]